LDYKSSKKNISNKREQKILLKIGLKSSKKNISNKREQKVMLKIEL